MKKIIFIGCVVSLVFFSCKKDEKEDIKDGFSFPLKKVNIQYKVLRQGYTKENYG